MAKTATSGFRASVVVVVSGSNSSKTGFCVINPFQCMSVYECLYVCVSVCCKSSSKPATKTYAYKLWQANSREYSNCGKNIENFVVFVIVAARVCVRRLYVHMYASQHSMHTYACIHVYVCNNTKLCQKLSRTFCVRFCWHIMPAVALPPQQKKHKYMHNQCTCMYTHIHICLP